MSFKAVVQCKKGKKGTSVPVQWGQTTQAPSKDSENTLLESTCSYKIPQIKG